jgi:hypothetical protein
VTLTFVYLCAWHLLESNRSFGCVPGSPATTMAVRPKSPHPANSYGGGGGSGNNNVGNNGNAKSPWSASSFSPASPFPQTPSPALSFNPR